ncbi:MAG: hypothetical protein M1837_003741 [Sclerophora amabilis]|nr:MAG: hypothetical protein M1837_003741 [Sclerophora amabilis]
MRFSKISPGTLLCAAAAALAYNTGGVQARSPPALLDRRSFSPNATGAAGNTRDLFVREILQNSAEYGGFANFSASAPTVPLKVGIVGAGATGLYAAVLLESLGIDYEILEANTRVGGRMFTYRFDEEKWNASKPGEPEYYDYYDVGAMRFPGMAWMDRVIGKQNTSLISYINAHLKPEDEPVKLIPYIFRIDNTFRLYNDKLIYNQVLPSADNFDVLVSDGGTIDPGVFATASPASVFDEAIKDLIHELEIDFDSGFRKLMEYDQVSVRQYMLTKGFSPEQIDWMETVDDATTHYDTMSMSQSALEEWIFESAPLDSWLAIEGGMDRISAGMVKILSKSVETSMRVTAIKPAPEGALSVHINGTEDRTYAHVINTVPLGVMQQMDLTELNLDYRKKLAIRKLSYDPAGKIGMKFRSRWWEHLPEPFQGGQSFSDLPIRRCVYPSYGIETPDAAGAMIASYTWGQDSARLGSFYNIPDARDYVVETTLRDLARMNNVTHEFLKEEFVDVHLWDWYGDEFSVGAFAIFSPDQFSTMMPALMHPAHEGKLHFGGEALSSGHAWIIGAVNSAYRTVTEILAVEGMDDKLQQLVETWGYVDEIDMGWYSSAFSD